MKSLSTYCRRALAISVLTGLLCACANRSPAPNYYRLDFEPSPAQTELCGFSLGVGPASLSERLLRPQILNGESAIRISGNERHRWSEPLNDALIREISWNLGEKAPQLEIYAYPWAEVLEPDYVVGFQLFRFEAISPSQLELSGTLILIGAPPSYEVIESMRFTILEEYPRENIDALVRAHGRAGSRLADMVLELLKERL